MVVVAVAVEVLVEVVLGVGSERQPHAVETRLHPNNFRPLGAPSQFKVAFATALLVYIGGGGLQSVTVIVLNCKLTRISRHALDVLRRSCLS